MCSAGVVVTLLFYSLCCRVHVYTSFAFLFLLGSLVSMYKVEAISSEGDTKLRIMSTLVQLCQDESHPETRAQAALVLGKSEGSYLTGLQYGEGVGLPCTC